jgi:hypothetical protein
MQTEHREQVDQIFQAALDLSAEERSAYLDKTCATNPGLRAEVESLISSYEKSEQFMETSLTSIRFSILSATS